MDKPNHIPTGNRVIKSVHPLGHERWLIFAIQDSIAQRSSLRAMLKSLLVRFDSCLFSFYKNDDGGKKAIVYMILLNDTIDLLKKNLKAYP